MIDQTFVDVLKKISSLLQGHGINWVVIGSTSLALQGVDIKPKDVDIISTKDDTFRISEILKEYETKPPEFGKTHLFESYMGVYTIDRIKVEVMGDLRMKAGDEWVSLSERLVSPIIIEIDDMPIPVSSLKDQIVSYEKLGRPKDSERVRKIRDFLGQ